MFEQQRAVSFPFEQAQPIDVEGWIEINALPLRGSQRDQLQNGSQSVRIGHQPNVSGDVAAEDPRTCDSDPTAHEHCVQPRGCASPRPRSFQPTRRSSDVSAAESEESDSTRVCHLLRRLSCSRKHLAKGLQIIDLLPERHGARAGLDSLTHAIHRIDRESDRLQSFYAASWSSEVNAAWTTHAHRCSNHEAIGASDRSALDDASSEISDSSSSNMPAAIVDFFDAAGEVNLLLERISERELDLVECQALDSLGSETAAAVTDDNDEQLDSLRAALAIARSSAAEKRGLCSAQNLEPERYRYRRSSSSTA